MATSQQQMKISAATVAEYIAWARVLGERLAAFGWVKAGDTGQVDWVAAPPATLPGATYRDFEIYRMNDALQATSPVFLKLEYQNARIRLSMGKGSNGAGLLTGAGSLYTGAADVNWGAPMDCYFSGSDNRFGCFLGRGSTNNMAFSIERLKDGNGADSEGGAFIAGCLHGPWFAQVLPTVGAIGPLQGSPLTTLMPTEGSAVYGTYKGASPLYPWLGRALAPVLGIGAVKSQDITDGELSTMELYGQSRSYMAFKTTLAGYLPQIAQGANYGVLLRWE